MQLKTALLSTAVAAAIAGLALHAHRAGTAPASATAASASASSAAAAAAPRDAHAFAAAAQNKASLRALIDTSARPGSQRAWTSRTAQEADRSAAAERARGLLAGAGAQEVHLAQADGFNARDVMIDRDGTEHVRMERSYEGLPVIGGDMVVHSRDGELLSITQGSNMRTSARPELKPAISPAQARSEAGAQFDGRVETLSPGKLVVYARNGMQPTLAYQVDLRGQRNDSQGPGVMSYYLDARDGSLLQADDRYETAAANGTGKTLTLGDIGLSTDSTADGYRMVDVARGGSETIDIFNKDGSDADVAAARIFTDADNVWGNNATSDRATAAADVHYGVAATWDYFQAVHGRRGVDNNGSGIKAFVHFSKNYFNAGATTLSDADGNFVAYAMIYGDGDFSNGNRPLVAIDVAGHEMAHLVNGTTANLSYYDIKDSGGINEANSDIFGALVEFSVNNAKDPGDWLIGESIYKPTTSGTPKALRRMFDQASDGGSINCYPAGGFVAANAGQNEKYDPHYSSGVGNRFAYLLSQGAVAPKGFTSYTPAKLVCNKDTGVVGIGPAKLGAIWYRALTTYFVSSTDYPGARAGALSAAKDLYGADSVEYQTVARAWSAVNVN